MQKVACADEVEQHTIYDNPTSIDSHILAIAVKPLLPIFHNADLYI